MLTQRKKEMTKAQFNQTAPFLICFSYFVNIVVVFSRNHTRCEFVELELNVVVSFCFEFMHALFVRLEICFCFRILLLPLRISHDTNRWMPFRRHRY